VIQENTRPYRDLAGREVYVMRRRKTSDTLGEVVAPSENAAYVY
jgi:hypothetical protein